MESFDPIGVFRTKYRASGGAGLKVDASGVTAEGRAFSGMDEFKQLLLDQKEQIANQFVTRLIVFSTGGEIQFADRDEVQVILDRTREDDFPVRDIIHEVVQSKLFRNL